MSHDKIYLIPPPPPHTHTHARTRTHTHAHTRKALQYSYDRWRLTAVTFYSAPCIPVGTNDPPPIPLKTTLSPK